MTTLTAIGGLSIAVSALFTPIEKHETIVFDLYRIVQIESSGRATVVNPRSQATGLYQITPICLEEWNAFHPNKRYKMRDLLSPYINEEIARWYLERRLPQIFRYHGVPVSVGMCLVGYNWGPGNAVKWVRGEKELPKETSDYLKKYVGEL